eukprot:TRINITY_DN9781_c0_g1_i1.p1 TRINITY_DN9781_c0_g1~~TRINITY_DN9781_c0_g1_i1.p1  ORF type:complete len:237 (+),score=25.38 TRINITY_DN9781_c0_g1_i1:138-848(+)
MEHQPAQVEKQPIMQGTAQPTYDGDVQVGVPVVAHPVIVIAGGGGAPMPLVSDERLAQVAKGRRFKFESGQWKFISPQNYTQYILPCFIIILIIVVVMSKNHIVMLGCLLFSFVFLLALLFAWGKVQMTFNDSRQVVYYKGKGAFCIAKEATIRYSDCISINAVLKVDHDESSHHSTSHTSSYYAYSLTTLGGNYEVFRTQDNLEEASLNAFLRERLAAAGISSRTPVAPVGRPAL